MDVVNSRGVCVVEFEESGRERKDREVSAEGLGSKSEEERRAAGIGMLVDASLSPLLLCTAAIYGSVRSNFLRVD